MSGWLKDLLLRATVLTVLGAALGLANQWVRFGATVGDPPPAQVCEVAELIEQPVPLDVHEAAELCARPDVLILDVRSSDAFAHGHVAGALHLPCSAGSVNSTVNERLQSAGMILVYGDERWPAHPVATSLLQQHIRNVRLLEGGYPRGRRRDTHARPVPASRVGSPSTEEKPVPTSTAITALGWALKLFLSGIFAAAAIPKLRDPATFATEIANYQLLPELAWVGAAALPGLELVLAVGLLLFGLGSRWLQASAGIATGLMLLFTVAVTQVVLRGIDIECGCFGSGTGPVTLSTVGRDVALSLACATLLWLSYRKGEAQR